MDRKLYLGKDAEFQRRADEVLNEISSGKGQYYDADELADIADYFAVNNMHEKMEKVVKYGLHLHPDNIDLRIQEAYMYLDFGQLEQAEECLQKIAVSNRDTRQLEALLAYRQGDEEKADEILDELVLDAGPEDTYSIVGLMLDLDKPDEALEYLTDSDEDPEHEFYLDNLATCYRELGLTDLAIETLNKLIDKYPYQPNIWKVLGECYFDDQQYDKCIEACDFALATDEDYHPAILLKALAFRQLGNPDKAISYAYRAYELGGMPFLGFCYFEMSACYDSMQWEKAVSVFCKTMKYTFENNIGPENNYVCVISTLAALSFLHLQKWDDAFKIAQLLIQEYPDSPELYLVMAVVKMQQGKKKEANKYWKQLYQCETLSIDLLREAHDLCIEFDHFDESYFVLQKMHEMEPENQLVNLQLLMHCVMFDKKELLEELLSSGAIKVSKEQLEKLVNLLKDKDSDPSQLGKVMADVLRTICPELNGLQNFSDERIQELVKQLESKNKKKEE